MTAFDRAKVLHEAGQLDEAEALYREATSEADSFKAYNNLGTMLEDQGRFDEAIEAYQDGVQEAPGCFLLHYNLGHALHRSQRLSEAFLVYIRAVQLEPESFETHYNLGNLLLEQGRFESAITAYRRALDFHKSKQLFSNLGTALFENKMLEEAAVAYREAIEQDESDAGEHFHLGRTLDALSDFEEAISCYGRAIQLSPELSISHAHLVMLLQKLHRDHEAEAAFDAWRTAIPGDPIAEHMWASYSQQDVPARASDSYVKAVFDQFASDYDNAMAQMNYRGPQLLSEKLNGLVPKTGDDIVLDAGCGTGLCGPLLRPYAKQLLGVDLSIAMLERARTRDCYDNLVQAELTTHLKESTEAFDIIVAADAVPYFGDTRELSEAAFGSLRDNGLLLLTVDAIDADNTSDNYVIGHNGRYSHAIEYVGLNLQRAGFRVLSTELVTIRHEAAEDVKAHLIVASKNQS